MARPDFNLVMAEDVEGRDKPVFTRVGAGWKSKNGGVFCRIAQGVSIGGTFNLFPNDQEEQPRKERNSRPDW